jgi:hypothetical protein
VFGLDEIAVEHIVRLCDRDDPDALEAHADLGRNGYRAPMPARSCRPSAAARRARAETRRVFQR